MGISLKKITHELGLESSVTKPLGLRRKKLWELEHRVHCSIAGTCFTLEEMRRFCRKSSKKWSLVKSKNPLSDYRLHINFVTMLGDALAARPAAKYLDHKYQAAIVRFDQADSPSMLKALWEEAVSQGQIAAAYWSVMTHPLASEDLLFHVYGEVHMLSHLAGAAIRLDLQVLTQLRQSVPQLEQELALAQTELLQRTRQKDEAIDALNKRLDGALHNEQKLFQKLQEAEVKIQSLEDGDMLRHLRMQLEKQAEQLSRVQIRAEKAEAEAAEFSALANAYQIQNEQLENQFLELTIERSALESALENVLATPPALCEKSEVYKQKIDLAGRCILYVGGRNRLCGHFRTLVEQQNGRFIHYDGGREESPQRLDALVSQVDAVLCPLDCVSHNAVHRIKLDCKRYGKHLTLLSQSSLSAFTKGVHEFSLAGAR